MMNKYNGSMLSNNSMDLLTNDQSGLGSNSNSNQGTNSASLNLSQPSTHTDCSLTTDDEDSDHKSTLNYKERRREAHTQAEQKRRDAIKKGYEDLQYLVPTCQQQDAVSSYKLSKATILQRSIDYIQFLQMQKKKQDEDLQNLRKEVVALQIMKSNYEQIVKLHQQNQPGNLQSNLVSDDVKFHVFQAICDGLFQSFDSCVKVRDFNEISACIFSWIEENCKPSTLRSVTMSILSQIKKEQQLQQMKKEGSSLISNNDSNHRSAAGL